MFLNPEDKLSKPDHNWHGSAIAWHHTLNTMIENVSTTNERFTGVQVNFPGCKLLAISVYFPTSGKDDEFLNCIDNLSHYIVENKPEDGEVIIGTDSNCSKKSSSRRYLAFCNFYKEFSLLKLGSDRSTYHHPGGTAESNIDFFLISSKSAKILKNIFTLCTLDNPLNFSSHDVVSGTLEIPQPMQEVHNSNFNHTYTEFKQNRIIWNEDKIKSYQEVSGALLSKCEATFPDPEFIPLKCNLFLELLVRSAELCIDSKQSTR